MYKPAFALTLQLAATDVATEGVDVIAVVAAGETAGVE